jgi:hypothetical protein
MEMIARTSGAVVSRLHHSEAAVVDLASTHPAEKLTNSMIALVFHP